MAQPKIIKVPSLEIKDRVYILNSNVTPISFQLRSRHTKYNQLLYFDGRTNRALRYCSNQKSPFVDMQDDNALLEPIIFEDGKLVVDSRDTVLQEFLSIYHPDANKVYHEFDPEENAQEDIEQLSVGINAQSIALDLDIADVEAIARVLWRSRVDKMASSEIRRDVLIYARTHPQKFLDLSNDTDIKLRNLAIKAVDMAIIGLKDDNTTIFWVDSNDIIIKLKYGDNPYTSLASYFKTDEGMDVMKGISAKLK